jgi:hypothetical protein
MAKSMATGPPIAVAGAIFDVSRGPLAAPRPVLSEGFDTADLKEIEALLGELHSRPVLAYTRPLEATAKYGRFPGASRPLSLNVGP